MNVNITIANMGDFPETFNINVYANMTVINQTQVTLAGGEIRNITCLWNTTGFTKGNYTISAYATPVLLEANTSDNNCTDDGTAMVTLGGDVNGDKRVEGRDIALLSKYYGKLISQIVDLPNARNIDVNDDNKIDGRDIAVAAKNFGQIWI